MRLRAVRNQRRRGARRRRQLTQLGWTVIVEQPTREAFAISTSLQQQLVLSITVALLPCSLVGYVWGRRFIEPILRLTRGTRGLAEGRLDERVAITRATSSASSGTAFNNMADRLVELQEDVRKKERHAMFGRIAIGLVHDLSHPIQNIGNGCKLIVQMFDDLEYRETFRRTIERELAAGQARARRPAQHRQADAARALPLDVNKALADLVDSMHADGGECRA